MVPSLRHSSYCSLAGAAQYLFPAARYSYRPSVSLPARHGKTVSFTFNFKPSEWRSLALGSALQHPARSPLLVPFCPFRHPYLSFLYPLPLLSLSPSAISPCPPLRCKSFSLGKVLLSSASRAPTLFWGLNLFNCSHHLQKLD